MRATRDCKMAATRQAYLHQVRHLRDPQDKRISSAQEAYVAETKALITECDLQIQEAIRALRPCLDELQFELTSIDSCCKFSANIYNLAGDCRQVNDLHFEDTLLDLYEKIADQFSIPNFV